MADKTTEFMLEEYKQIANGYQDLHAQQNELIKTYLTLVAVPASILAIVVQFVDKLPSSTEKNSTSVITPLSTDIVQKSIAQTLSAIEKLTQTPAPVSTLTPTQTNLSTTIFSRAVSSGDITGYAMPILLVLLFALTLIGFAVVMALTNTRAEALLYVKTVNGIRRYFVENDPKGNLNKYLVLPDFDAIPKYWEGFKRTFWNVFLISLLNSAVCFASFYALFLWIGKNGILISSVLAILYLFMQIIFYYCTMKKNDKKYEMSTKFKTPFSSQKRLIGVDLDGVLGNLADEVIKMANENYNLQIKIDDITSHRLQECTPLTLSQVCEIFESTNIFKNLKPVENACESVKKLRLNNWVVFVITDRFWTKQDWILTKAWLENNDFEWDHLNLVRAKDKSVYADAHKLTVFVEDNLQTALDLATVCEKVFLFDRTYNQGEVPDNVKRVTKWKEILRELQV
jgi:uncharacterized protein